MGDSNSPMNDDPELLKEIEPDRFLRGKLFPHAVTIGDLHRQRLLELLQQPCSLGDVAHST